MNEWTGFLCLGSIVLVPIVTFVVGFMIGRDKLPFKICIERNKKPAYEVDHDLEG